MLTFIAIIVATVAVISALAGNPPPRTTLTLALASAGMDAVLVWVG